MKIVDHKNLSGLTESEFDLAWETASAEAPISQTSYHEMSDRPVVEVDAMTQLENNVRLLGDLQGRLSFLMREVNYLLKV
ncbi:MAG TPA: hypothetical protein PL182_03385 [Pseudobdellovibrionaceae bacterium]|nr:hypothetical protein [Pseudobdellovibrionaceae bacterium]